MVVALGPGKFYGSRLPRPRFYSDVKLNDERVDPPVSILDPLLFWANEAHWSMGGLSLLRHRLQGRLEGSIKKLRVQQDRSHSTKLPDNIKVWTSGKKPILSESLVLVPSNISEKTNISEKIAPVRPSLPLKKRARKLMDEFEMVAAEEKAWIIGNDTIEEFSPKKRVNEENTAIIVSSHTRTSRSPRRKRKSLVVVLPAQ